MQLKCLTVTLFFLDMREKQKKYRHKSDVKDATSCHDYHLNDARVGARTYSFVIFNWNLKRTSQFGIHQLLRFRLLPLSRMR